MSRESLDVLCLAHMEVDTNVSRLKNGHYSGHPNVNPRIHTCFSKNCLIEMAKLGINITKPSTFIRKFGIPQIYALANMMNTEMLCKNAHDADEKINWMKSLLDNGRASLYWYKNAIQEMHAGFTLHPKDKTKEIWSSPNFFIITANFCFRPELNDKSPFDIEYHNLPLRDPILARRLEEIRYGKTTA